MHPLRAQRSPLSIVQHQRGRHTNILERFGRKRASEMRHVCLFEYQCRVRIHPVCSVLRTLFSTHILQICELLSARVGILGRPLEIEGAISPDNGKMDKG
jgi:hypothetical protein